MYSRLGRECSPIERVQPFELIYGSSYNPSMKALMAIAQFFAFCRTALVRELVDQNRATYVASFEKDHGPIDPRLTARLEALLAR